MKMKFAGIVFAAVAVSLAGRAKAAEISGTITFVETSYMPQYFYFRVTTAQGLPSRDNTSCPPTALIEFSSTDPALVKAAYATVMAGFFSQARTYVVYDPATVGTGHTGTCLVKYVGLGTF